MQAPRTLPHYDVDVDFSYHFFNDAMAARSGLSVSGLTAGQRNAKSDFPSDYAAYFEDDAAVRTWAGSALQTLTTVQGPGCEIRKGGSNANDKAPL